MYAVLKAYPLDDYSLQYVKYVQPNTCTGTMPSEVMKIRINTWQMSESESDGLCRCDSHQNAVGLRYRQHQPAIVILSLVQFRPIPTPLHRLQQIVPFLPANKPSSNESVQSEYGAESAISQIVNDEIETICKYIDEFIESLFDLMSSENSDIIVASISLIEKLLNCGLAEIAVPLLVTLLQESVPLLAVQRKRVYKLLIDALNKLEPNEQINMFDKFILRTICTYISSQKDLSQLPNIQSTLLNVLKFLVKQKSPDLLSYATESVCSNECSSVFTTMLELYSSHEDLVPTDSKTQGIIKYLEALYSMDAVDKRDESLASMMSAVWLNPDLSEIVAKLIASILPHDFLGLINSECTLVIAPKGSDKELYQYELDIRHKVASNIISPFEAALKYLDLMKDPNFIQYPHQTAMCLLKSATYFAMELERTDQQSKQYALRNAVSMLTYDASQLATRLHPGMRIFVLASSYRLTCSVAKLSDPTTHSCLSGRVACGLLKNLVYNSKFTYLLSHPMSLQNIWVSASHDINQISDLAQEAYIKHLLSSEKSLSIKRSLLQYQYFENLFRKQQWNVQLNNVRVKAMSELLKDTEWTLDDVSKAMKTSLLQRNPEGYIEQQHSLGNHLEIAELKGVTFDCSEASPSICVIIKPAEDGNGLLSFKDILEMLQLTSGEAEMISFSLDPASERERYHPFMKKRCHPKKLESTEFMESLFHADYLLKFLTTGVEVSAEPPFDFKGVTTSLIKNMSDNLEFICRPPSSRGTSYMKSFRFWIEAEKIFYDEHVHESTVSYYIGDVKLTVNSRPMVTALNGNKFDAKHSVDGPQADFAKDLTHHYEELSKYFPIFARVRELCKLQFMCQKLHSKLQSLEQTNEEQFASFSAELNRLSSLHPIKDCPNLCPWVPSTYNNSVYGGVLFKPAPSHTEHFSKPGCDFPTDIPAEPAFPVVHDSLIQDANPILHAAGGVHTNFEEQYKINVSQFGPDVKCVRLGQTVHDSSKKGADLNFSSDESEKGISDFIDETTAKPTIHGTVTPDNKVSSTTRNELGKLLPPSNSPSSNSSMKHERDLSTSEAVPVPKRIKDFSSEHDTMTMNDRERNISSNNSGLDHRSELSINPTSSTSVIGVREHQDDAQNVRSEESGINPRLENPDEPQFPRNVTYPIESDIDLVVTKAAKHQIVFLSSYSQAPRDTLTNTFRQTLINQALFGNVFEHPDWKRMVETKYDFNETDFHSNVLARQQIKTALILRKIAEFHYKHRDEELIILQ